MEGGYSSDQLERRGSEPTLNEDSGTLESSILFTKRNIPEAPEEEEEEPQAPLREQDLKETYIQLVQGVQEWQDGCVYRGHFGLDMKLGYGEFSWPTGESYHGQFYRDHRHGFGTYMWPDGSSFTGMFYLSFREGYGTMYMKTRLFQGLYKADERFGPGIETYPDGSQEVGLWFREHLIKLCTEIPCSVSISSYPEFEGFLTHSPARISLSEEETMHWDLQEERDPFFYDYKQFLLNDDLTLPPDVYLYSTDNTHMPITRSFRRDLDSRIFLHDIPPFVEDGEPWFIKNETPLMVKIQKHAYKFRNKKEHSSWNMGAILEGDRSGFACRGPKERLAKEMILKAEEGNYDWIYGILRDNLASPDVADARGYTVLAAAAIHCHINIINLLLDNGADVNKCTDEGLTPLNMCFLLYYPATSFRPNIAERTVPEPQCFPKETQKLSVSHYSSFTFRDSDSIYNDDLVPISESPKSSIWRDSPQKWESTLPRGSVGISDQGQELEDVLESLDRCTPCSSTETNFESNHCVQNYSIRLSWNMLEKSARAYSMLKVPSTEAISDKGTMRQMAWTMTKHRNMWLTINCLLHRGADPNLCRVPMHVLFFAVKAGDVDGVKLLLESGARTDIQFPPELGALTPLHIAAALPGEEGVKITELLLHAITDVDARAADQDDVYKLNKPEVLPSSMKLNNEVGPPRIYSSVNMSVPEEGGRTPLHVACEREDNYRYARDVVHLLLSNRANSSLLWGGHSPLSLSIASGNDLIVKELLTNGADPNLPLTKGLGSALCVACDIAYEHRRSVNSRLGLIDLLINYGADILAPVTLMQGDKVAVGTAVDYGYFKFFQDRKIAHCPFHTLMPAERETFVARKRLLEYMGFQLRSAIMAKESQWDPKVLCLSKKAQMIPCHRLKQRDPSMPKDPQLEELEQTPFFKFCYQCGRSIGVRLLPCSRCYGILTCSKSCKTKAWADFHGRDCGTLAAIGRKYLSEIRKKFKKSMNKYPETLGLLLQLNKVYTSYSHE
ncbi:Ankyrin repeat and MYND domain-containing protein 1 [Myotis brandtii]|uniref:Ankyrin repeat and MYND domain-containing protein 1 n=1 Tax=Myotis brandtii TaxID=109478 RepID=S7NXS2_MYOBR|nr:PREDICTED: ankyrin repeat and MYND domain-containing protein 1 isoform X1 [Myotis brandtii]XP_005857766.1 PREDICTED: ankyrin repeat and MYND domain-containing protein 1 isoform X1 [Myotis brandtii]EPQ02403.1 Ankyrin repeat and MYND domain-containing protein 1 [Myotis brandtii]